MSVRSILKAFAAAVLSPVILVLEGGRWVLRSLSNTHPVPVPVSAVEEAAEAALQNEDAKLAEWHADNARSKTEWAQEHRHPFAVRAKQWLWSQAGEWMDDDPDISVLPAPVQAWLQGLTPEQRVWVKDRTHLSDLERHLRGEHFSDLPRLLTEPELLARAEAVAAERRATHDILQSLIDGTDNVPVSRAA